MKKKPKERKDIFVRTTPELRDAVQRIADRDRRSVSEIVRFAIEEYVEKHK